MGDTQHPGLDRVSVMADPDLHESAWKRATSDAARTYPTTGFEIAATLVTIIFGAVAAVVSAGENTTTQIAAPIIGGALALSLTFGIVFVAWLVAAPLRQRNELRQHWTRPEPEPVQPVDVGLSLRDFRRRGDDLVNSFRQGYDPEDEETGERWTQEVIQFLSKHVDPGIAKTFIDASRSETSFLPSLEARVAALDGIIDGVE